MLDFARKVCNQSYAIDEQDFATLRQHGLDDEDAWDIAGITASGLSNRMASTIGMRANAEFYAMGAEAWPAARLLRAQHVGACGWGEARCSRAGWVELQAAEADARLLAKAVGNLQRGQLARQSPPASLLSVPPRPWAWPAPIAGRRARGVFQRELRAAARSGAEPAARRAWRPGLALVRAG